MGREEGGGFRMGNTGIPVADSFRYMAKPIQYCKVKKKKRLEFLIYLMNTCRLVDSSENRPHIQPTVSLGLDMVTDMQA